MKRLNELYNQHHHINIARFVPYLLAFTLFCLGMYLVPFSIMHFNFKYIPGDFGDARLNNYFLEHGFKWLSGQTDSFWNAPFFYPHPRTMTFSDNLLGTLPVYASFRLLKIDRETSYQLWFIAIYTLNFFSAALVLKRLKINYLGALLGAYVFTFSPPVLAHIYHAQLLPRFMIPFGFYFGIRYIAGRDAKNLLMLCGSVVMQFYCSIYLGFFLCLCLLLFFLAYGVFNIPALEQEPCVAFTLKKVSTVFLILSISLLALLPLLIPYYRRSIVSGVNSWEIIVSLLPTLRTYFYPHEGTIMWDWLIPTIVNYQYPCEHQLFAGMLPWLAIIVVIILFAYNQNDGILRTGIVILLTLVFAIILTINIDGFTFYKLVTLLPGAKSIRGVSRIILVDLFLFSVLVGTAVTKIVQLLGKRYYAKMTFALCITLLLMIDVSVKPAYLPRYLKAASQERSRAVEGMVLKKNSRAGILVYMPEKCYYPPNIIQLDAMLAAQSLNMATVNGFSARSPKGYDFFNYYYLPSALVKWMYMNGDGTGERIFGNMVIVGQEIDLQKRSFRYAMEPLPEDGYRFELQLPKSLVLRAKEGRIVRVELRNSSGVAWPSLGDGRYQIVLSYRWLARDGRVLTGFDDRIPLPYDLSPGESSQMDVYVEAPNERGDYVLEFDMVQEQVYWFHDRGARRPVVNVSVI
ncbi:MAG TPA: hypothetical protein VMU60_13260 [Syntrophobacteria bacterium]|nr:hypothetical protein [Syntrophobacteria bacterium]